MQVSSSVCNTVCTDIGQCLHVGQTCRLVLLFAILFVHISVSDCVGQTCRLVISKTVQISVSDFMLDKHAG